MAKKQRWKLSAPFSWWTHIPFNLSEFQNLYSVAIHDTRLYAATHGDPHEPASLHAIDLETGEVHWSVVSATEGIGQVTGASATGPTFWQRGEGVRGHDAATGRELWRREDAESTGHWPAGGGRWTGARVPVVIGPAFQTIALLDVQTGRSLWEVTGPVPAWPQLRVGDTFICRGGHVDGEAGLQARSVLDGSLVGDFDTTAVRGRSEVSPPSSRETVDHISTDGETVFAIGSGRRVIAVGMNDGCLKWVSSPSVVVGQSVMRIGTAVACQVMRDFASLDPDTGALLARRSGVANGRLWSPGCQANGLFWFADWDELVALVPQNGQEYCRLRLPERGLAPIAAGRWLIVPLKRSVVCVDLDAISGS